MKISYGQIGPKPRYNRAGPKVCLHVGGIVEYGTEKMIEMKFGVFGSIGDVNFLPDKNIGIEGRKPVIYNYFSLRRDSGRIC